MVGRGQKNSQKSPVTNSPIEPLAVSIPEGCRMIGLKRSSMYREVNDGRIKAVKARGRTLLPVASLRAWLAALPHSIAA